MSDPRLVLLNDLTYDTDHLDPMESLKDALAFASDDWGESRAKAWIYGIVMGWDDDDLDEEGEEAMQQMADRWGWTGEQVARLRELHVRFDALRNADSEQV